MSTPNTQPAVKQDRSFNMTWIGAASLGLVTMNLGPFAPAARAAAPDARSYDEQVRPFLIRHCLGCHGAEKPKKGLRLDQLSPDFADPAGRARWESVLKRVQAGEMPPAGKPQPSAGEVQVLADWITGQAAAQAAQGRVVLRRLNRIEYENTVHDLLGVEVPLKEQLPEDGAADWF